MATESLDRKCMIAVRRGDFEAFEQIYHQYYRRLYSFFYRLCWDAEHAEDLLQETFIRLWKGARHFDTKSALAPYLYRIGKNAWIDFERRRGNRKTWDMSGGTSKSGTEVLHEALSINDPGATMKIDKRGPGLLGDAQEMIAAAEGERPEDKAKLREVEHDVRAALWALDPDKRLVVVMSFYQGLKLQEIADILELPLGTVKSRLFHAERKLRESLKHLVKES